jgi:cytochrome b involved in lipid metabolism
VLFGIIAHLLSSFLTALLFSPPSASLSLSCAQREMATTTRHRNVQAAAPLSRSEVRKHVLPDDAWVIHQRNVLDVSTENFKHPGGGVIYTM